MKFFIKNTQESANKTKKMGNFENCPYVCKMYTITAFILWRVRIWMTLADVS